MMDLVFNLLVHGEFHSWAMTAYDCKQVALGMGLTLQDFSCVVEVAA